MCDCRVHVWGWVMFSILERGFPNVVKKRGCWKGLTSRGVRVGVRVLRVHVHIYRRVHSLVRVHPSHLLRHALGRRGGSKAGVRGRTVCDGDLSRYVPGASGLSFPAESVNQISLFFAGIRFASEISGQSASHYSEP